jgi:uncharacterized protein YeaO (DUF488 family)
MPSIQVKRVYAAPDRDDGARFLVDRFWPRGMRKAELKMDAWLKDVAPSGELCRWFGHDPARWEDFCSRYWRELSDRPSASEPLRDAMRRGKVTLLFSARDENHNNAVALRSYLERRQGKG